MKRKIIIAGYPKSGNTWLTRLTAELIGCPTGGFLYNTSRKETEIEGVDRESEYICYKSHHQLNEIAEEDLINSKIIYIIRDPRDIVISGESYFYNLNLFPDALIISNYLFRLFAKIVNKVFKIFYGNKLMRRKMIKAVLNGNKDLNFWVRTSWKNHIKPYYENKTILKVKYESLLSNPIDESKRIIEFIGIKADHKQIENAINLHSFSYTKSKFKEAGLSEKAAFLRKGKSEQWRKEFSKREKEIFTSALKDVLESLNYHI